MKIYCKKYTFGFNENNSYEYMYILDENSKCIESAVITDNNGSAQLFSINLFQSYFCDIKELRKIKLINLELIK